MEINAFDTTSRGLGITDTQVSVIGSGAAVGATAVASSVGATAAIPYIGPAVAAVMLVIMAFRRRGRQKQIASQYADEIESYMQENLAAWEASSKNESERQQCLSNFDQLWNEAVGLWSDPSLGSAGQRAIQERGEGGRPPWGKNWFELYRYPISEYVAPSGGGVGVSNATTQITSAFGLNPVGAIDWGIVLPVLVIGGVVLSGMMKRR